MELQEELTPADAVLLLGAAPERISDLVYGLDESRLRYRHGPAFPTLGGLLAHLLESGSRVDGLLRRAHLEGLTTADLRGVIDPGHDQGGAEGGLTAGTDAHLGAGLDRPLQEAIEDFARVRRRTVDLLHGWGKNEWSRVISDPHGISLSLLEICQQVVRHEVGHVAQIRNLTSLLPEPEDLGALPS